MYFSKYSLTYAIATCVWCTIFLEYWKIQEVDLSIRWNVQGIGKVKVNRPQFKYDKIIKDEAGQEKHYFPKWKTVSRQLLQIPFVLLSALALGAIIVLVFAIEVLISEGYDGPYKNLIVSSLHDVLVLERDANPKAGIRSDLLARYRIAVYQ